MTGLNKKEKEKLVVDLYENGSSYHEIAKEARVSLRDIKGILDRANGVQSLSKASQAYQMFSDGKSPMEVAIALDMREPDVTQLYKESWTLKQIYDLNSIYLETKGDLRSFLELYRLSNANGLNAEHVFSILKLADNDLSRLEGKYYNLKSEVRSLEAKKGGLIRTIQEYENQLGLLGKSFDNYCRLCQEEEEKLSDIQRQRLKEECLVNYFENDNEEYLRIKNAVEEKAYTILSNGASLLKLAVACVIHSIRSSPEQYASLMYGKYLAVNYNLPSYSVHIDDYSTQDLKILLANDAAKLYSMLAKDLVDEILSNYNIGTSQASIQSISQSDLKKVFVCKINNSVQLEALIRNLGN
jgi:hypothetical protein